MIKPLLITAAVAACPPRARTKIDAASCSLPKSAYGVFSPWSESRPPIWWKKSCRFPSASTSAVSDPILTLAAASSLFTQGLNRSGRCTLSAPSGRNAG